MARTYAQIKVGIWADDDWRTLSGDAQRLYFLLLTSPSLSHCGVADWRPNRLAALASDWTTETTIKAAAELAERLYVVIDEDTEEILLRSFVRHDGLMLQPKMATAMATAHAGIASRVLRGVVVHELKRLFEEAPDLKGWGSRTALELLAKPSVDPTVYGSLYPSGKGIGKGIASPGDMGPETGALLPAPTPVTKSQNQEQADTTADAVASDAPDTKPKTPRGARLKAGWMPSEDSRKRILKEIPSITIDDLRREHASFEDYWLSKAGRDAAKIDWDRAWCKWMRDTDWTKARTRTGQSALNARDDALVRHRAWQAEMRQTYGVAVFDGDTEDDIRRRAEAKGVAS